MKLFDKLFAGIIMGYTFIMVPFLILWWTFYILNINVFYGVGIGLTMGIVLNILFLKKSIYKFFDLSNYILVLIYIFYTIGIFGFFMGVPIFNIIPGILAGVYIARKMCIDNKSIKVYKNELKKISIFSFIVLLLMCISSAILALADTSTTSNLEGMFNLNINMTQSIIWYIVIIGGISLLIIQYVLINTISNLVYKNNA